MPDIPLPQPNNPDIFSYGFDKSLNRPTENSAENSVAYNVVNPTQSQNVQLGSFGAGSGVSNIQLDPTQGQWMGATKFADAHFSVNMGGDLRSSDALLTGVTTVSKLQAIAPGGAASHILFNSISGPATPVTGDFWFDGMYFKIRVGAVTEILADENYVNSQIAVATITPSNVLEEIFTADEDISSKQSVFVSDGTQKILKVSSVGNGTKDFLFGETTNAGFRLLKRGQKLSFLSPVTITRIKVPLQKMNSPGDSVKVGIQTDDGTANHYPTGTWIDSATLAASSMTSGYVEYDFDISATLDSGPIYHLVLERTGAGDNTNNYGVRGSSDSPYGTDVAELFWTLNDPPTYTQIWVVENNAWDLQFKLYGATSTAGRILKTSAAYAGYYETFIGFAKNAIAAGVSGTITIGGVVSGLTLTTGKLHYLSDTFGAISTSVGSNTRKAGISLSATNLLINNIW